MTLMEFGEYVVINGDILYTYNIGFINNENLEDETQFSAFNLTELDSLYNEFCKENNFRNDTVIYIELIENN